LLCFTQLRALGRKTRGVVAMKLREGDKMAAMDIIPATMHRMPGKYNSRYYLKSGYVILVPFFLD
jgi:DNA gyrase/topoisomerase IV subunit A